MREQDRCYRPQNAVTDTGIPSASIAIVQGGAITYLQAYGDGRIEPRTPAVPSMRYSIGSISKQFTAAASLLLAEQGKLSLDDPVSRFVPNLTRGNEVTIRQLLVAHLGLSGLLAARLRSAVHAASQSPPTRILDQWARKPLDFDPGTQWQYSNTNFVIAGLIVEKASGEPLLQFLSEHIFAPLGMKSVINIDQNRLTETDATGYLRYALGPPRLAPKEGKGWLFAAGELAMPAEDLAKWDISMINQTVLKPASYAQMEKEVVLKNGLGTRYGLGVGRTQEFGQRAIEHGGEVSGFTATEFGFPRRAHGGGGTHVNEDSVGASGDIARKIAALLFREADAGQARRAVAGNLCRTAAGQDRSRAVHRQLQQLLHRTGAQRFCRQPRAAGSANRVHTRLPNRIAAE